MTTVPFALYDAFSETAFGGSQAGVVSSAASLNKQTRQDIATEIGAPATAFIGNCDEQSVTARFHSPLTEYSMCGHGTICMMTRMVELGFLQWDDHGKISVELRLPASNAPLELVRRQDGRPEVFLDITPPQFSQQTLDRELLAGLLGLRVQDINQDYPLETALGAFNHLIVPLSGLEAMARITPDFRGLTHFSQRHGIQTIAVFCVEVDRADSDVHMRDFCPLVGVAESSGAGTTNAALATYLIRHSILQADDENGKLIVQAEQGIELERPGTIRSVVSMRQGGIARLQVGGVATKIIDGELYLP